MESWQETEDVCSSMNRMSCAVRAKSHHFSERLSSTRKTIQGVPCSISSVGRKCVPSGRM